MPEQEHTNASKTTIEIEASPSLWSLSFTLTLVILRATDHINWHWVWVTAPAWIPGLILFVWGFIIFVSNKGSGDDNSQPIS